MQIQRLVYHGKREEGTINVGRLDVLSPWRKFKYYKGLSFQVGKIVPHDVAHILAKDYPDHFRIETKQLDERDAHVYHLSDAVEECLAALGDDKAAGVVREVVEKYFPDHLMVDRSGQKEQKEAEKKPPAKKKTTTRKRTK
jgi:hypothetical protein